MGILDNLFGNNEPQPQKQTTQNPDQSADEAAIERYRYMLKTAPPETLEQAHAEAFAKLTPEQRQQVLQQLQENLPEAERAQLAQNGDDPQALARAATRAEVRQPGTIERTFGGGAGGIGFGGMLAGGFLSSIAGAVVGSYIAQQFFDNDSNSGTNEASENQEANADESAQNEDASANETGEAGDLGGDFGGDFGGEF